MRTIREQRSRLKLLSIVAVVALGTLAGNTVYAQNLRGNVVVDGSSTVYPITEAVAEEFRKEQPNVRVTVGISGTGGGFKRFAIGETDISNASRPIKATELAATHENNIAFIELPIAYDGLSIVVNRENIWCKSLTIEQLRSIYIEGSTVKSWRDLDPSYPDIPIKLYGPGADSGTFDYFREVVIRDGNVRSDMSPSEDDNVLVTGVAGDRGAIGFFGCAYYFENKDKLNVVAIDGGKGPVAPSPETIENGTYAPLSRPLFIYVNARSARKPQVRAFVTFYLKHAAKLADEVGYVRLPSEVYARAERNFDQMKTGTYYLDETGNPIEGPVSEVYK